MISLDYSEKEITEHGKHCWIRGFFIGGVVGVVLCLIVEILSVQ